MKVTVKLTEGMGRLSRRGETWTGSSSFNMSSSERGVEYRDIESKFLERKEL